MQQNTNYGMRHTLHERDHLYAFEELMTISYAHPAVQEPG